MTLDDFLRDALSPVLYQRRGQSLMNALFVHRQDLHARMTGVPELDPFYDERLLHVAIQFLRDHWEDA